MDGMLIKPPDFNPSRRYPVYQFTYAGPGAAQVRDQWGGADHMFHQLLAQHGVVVLDPRQPERERQGCGVTVAGLRPARRAGAAGSRRRRHLAEAADLGRSVAPRPQRLELRWLHDRVRTDAQHELVGGHRRRTGHGLARLRHRVHRTADEDAAAQSGRLPPHGTALRGRSGCTVACCSSTEPWTTTCTCRTQCSSRTNCRRPASRSR